MLQLSPSDRTHHNGLAGDAHCRMRLSITVFSEHNKDNSCMRDLVHHEGIRHTKATRGFNPFVNRLSSD